MTLQRRYALPASCGLQLALFAAIIAGCAPAVRGGREGQVPSYDYRKHGTDWSMGMCGSRERQSPINFDTKLFAPPEGDVEYHYEPIGGVILDMTASSGLLSVDLSNSLYGGVVYNKEWFPLVRIDIHGPAEHLIRGLRHPLEIQLIHRKVSDPMRNLAVSILVWSEHSPIPAPPGTVNMMYLPPNQYEVDFNPQLQHFLTSRPPAMEGGVSQLAISPAQPLDISQLIESAIDPTSSQFMRYAGSLTAPPCVDRTTWFVRQKTVIASDAQMKAFADSLYAITSNQGNYREVMPTYDRPVSVWRLVNSARLNLIPGPGLPMGPNPRTDGELKAVKMAKKAQEKSAQAARYVEDFARRLGNARQAYADNVMQTPPPVPKIPANVTRWKQSVARVRAAITSVEEDAKRTVDDAIRQQVGAIHNWAADEAEAVARMQPAPTSGPPMMRVIGPVNVQPGTPAQVPAAQAPVFLAPTI